MRERLEIGEQQTVSVTGSLVLDTQRCGQPSSPLNTNILPEVLVLGGWPDGRPT